MRIVSLSGIGVLSFNCFTLDLNDRVTFLVGPNGAGKSNLTRLLTICERAVDSADGATGDVSRLLAGFLAARHVGSPVPGIKVSVSVRLTEGAERELVTEFIRALVTGALTDRGQIQNLAEIDAWAEAEITEAKLAPLMSGKIVVSHPGTPDGRWECAYEFIAPDHDGADHGYQWIMMGQRSHVIVDLDTLDNVQGSDVATRITGSSVSDTSADTPVPDRFALLDLLPKPDLATISCAYQGSGTPTASQRRFAEMTGIPLFSPGQGRMTSLATVLRLILRRALVQTSDTRLLPAVGTSWSSSQLGLSAGAEARLPELWLALKNGDPGERARYQQIRTLFTEFTQGRGCEVRLVTGESPDPGVTAPPVPALFVTVDTTAQSMDPQPEIPIEFAGAGAWEAVVLASVLGEPAASVAVLDEPAVALHPSLQRQLGGYLLDAGPQFLVVTHSAELVPLTGATDVRLIRLDRDDTSSTHAWPLSERCRVKMAKKLVAKGNERLPFAWRAILCEGQDDVAAITTFAECMRIDLRRRNIAVTDCGSRDNLADYVWFCTELGLRYLAVMDADAGKADALPKAQAVRDAVQRHQGGELVEFPVNLETTFSVSKQTPSLVPGAIQAMHFPGAMPDPTQARAEVVALADAILRLTK
jgi:hypothetical protein